MHEGYHNLVHSNYELISAHAHNLFKSSPIAFYDYARFYDDGRIIGASTNPDAEIDVFHFLPTHVELELFRLTGQRITYMSHLLDLPPGVDFNDPDKYVNNIDCYTEEKVYHRLYFVDRIDDFYRISGFGVRRESKAAFNFYLNNLFNLESFIQAFEVKFKQRLDELDNLSPVILPYYNDVPAMSLQDMLKDPNAPALCLPEFFAPEPVREESLFTKREADCIELVAKGYSMKAAAVELGISSRTVEQHVRNAKEKNGIYTKQQLVELWHANTN